MTYEQIRAELHQLRDQAAVAPLPLADLRRATQLVGALTKLGLSPRQVGLSLRQLKLNPRAQTTGRRRGRR